MLRTALASTSALLACLAFAVPAGAADFSVNDTGDTSDADPGDGVCLTAAGKCTLRAAVDQANQLGGADTVNLPAGTYVLTLGALTNTGQVAIVGTAGARATTIDAQHASGIISTDNNDPRVTTFNGVTLANASGSAINDRGDTNVLNSVLTGTTTGSPPIYAYYGTVTIDHSTISGNSVTTGSTAAVALADHGGLTVRNSTIAGNTLTGDAAPLLLANNFSGMTIDASTIAANSLPASSSTVEAINGSSGTLHNSIVVGASGLGSTECTGLTSQGHNVVDDGSCGNVASDKQVASAGLQPLANNGGPTDTMAITSVSPAYDAGDDGACQPGDQRGTTRPRGSHCDVGAYERVPVPHASLSPTPLAFGDVQVGAAKPLDLTVTNDGDGPLSVTQVLLENAPGFHLAGDNCQSVAPGSSCVVHTNFAPTQTGAASGTLKLVDNTSASPHSVSLSGNGTPAPVPTLSTDPTDLQFGDQVHGTSRHKDVTVHNGGQAPLQVSSIEIEDVQGHAFSVAGSCPTVAAGEDCVLSVEFAPGAVQSYEATLTLTDNAPGSPHHVPLHGDGVNEPPTVPLPDITDVTANGAPFRVGARFTQGQAVATHATCNGGGSGYTATRCEYPNPLDTSTVGGPFTFTVDAENDAGKTNRAVIGYYVDPAPVPAPDAGTTPEDRAGVAVDVDKVLKGGLPAPGLISGDAKVSVGTDVPDTTIIQGSGVIAPGSGNVIAPGSGNVIAGGDGNVIAPGSGNVIAPGSGNLIPVGGYVIAPGSGNVIAPGSGNVIAPGSGNVIAPGSGNVIAPGSGNRLVARRAATTTVAKGCKPRKHHRCLALALLFSGGHTFATPGKATIRLVPTQAGRKVLRRYQKQARAARRKHHKVKPLHVAVTTVVGPVKPGSGPAVYTSTIVKIKS